MMECQYIIHKVCACPETSLSYGQPSPCTGIMRQQSEMVVTSENEEMRQRAKADIPQVKSMRTPAPGERAPESNGSVVERMCWSLTASSLVLSMYGPSSPHVAMCCSVRTPCMRLSSHLQTGTKVTQGHTSLSRGSMSRVTSVKTCRLKEQRQVSNDVVR